MSKNLTRKGYALGALVALASSLFAGSPALAADSVVLAADSTDKTLATPIDQDLVLNASLAPGSVSANISQLKYKVVTDGTFVVSAVAAGASAGGTLTKMSYSEDTTRVGHAYTAAGVKKTLYVAPGTTRNSSTDKNTLTLSIDAVPGATDGANGVAPASTDTTRSVEVTAFLDANNNSLFDEGEAFQTVTVKFVKYSEITSETTFTAPTAGLASTIAANVKFTNINNEQLSGADAWVGLATDTLTVANDATTAAWSATDFFAVTSAYVPVAKTAVKVQPVISGVAVGTASTQNVVATTIDFLAATVVKSTVAYAAHTTATAAETATVSKNKEFKVVFTGTIDHADSTLEAPVAGAVVKVTLAAGTALSATKTVTVNGTTYSTDAALAAAKLSATTDAKGQVSFTVVTVGFTTESVTLSATSQGLSASLAATSAAPTYAATSYTANSTSGTYQTVDGTAVSVVVAVKDQFGAAAPDATYDVSAYFTSSNQATKAATDASQTYAAVTGGKATLSILDNGTGTGTNVYALKLKTKDTNGVYSASADISNVTIKIVDAADNAAAKIGMTANGVSGTALAATSTTDAVLAIASGNGSSTTKATLATGDFAAYDGRNTETVDGSLAGSSVTLQGTVNSASSTTHAAVAQANASVTIAGAGMQFRATQNTKDVVGVDTLTVFANASGEFDFAIQSHLAGKQTVTITSGSVSVKVYLNFAAAAASSATKVAVKVADGAAQFQAGRALDVTLTVTDKFGNAVKITATEDVASSLRLSQTGAGYLASSGLIQTDATGVYTTKLITNFGDLGTSTIKAYFQGATTAKDVTTTVASEFGLTDADVTVGGRAVYASVEFAKGKTVTVSVDGKRLYSKLMSTDNYTELKFTQKTAGKHVVTVRVSGGVVVSETVVTTK